jgi:3-hydroxyacyl-CoA dehydrogenase, NAD binding domain
LESEGAAAAALQQDLSRIWRTRNRSRLSDTVSREFAGGLSIGRPERFLALHFGNEIWIRNIAEIMGHPDTDPSVFRAVVDFARRIGMEPIELTREQPGYVLNTLLVPFLRAGLDLLVDGVADHETVDKVGASSPVLRKVLPDNRLYWTQYGLQRLGIRRRERASHRPISQGELYRPRQARCLHRRRLLHVRRCELGNAPPAGGLI